MNTNPEKTEFRIENCVGCKAEIRLPSNIKPTAKIQCPICQKRFSLAEIDGPPVAIVIDEDEADERFPESVNVPFVDRLVTEKSGKEIWDSMNVPSYEKTTARGRAKLNESAVPAINRDEPSNRHPSQRKSEKRRKEQIKGNKKKDSWKMIVGAVLAIPVAQMVLWWVFAKDPLSLAPTVGKFAPMVVPEKLRSSGTPTELEEKDDPVDPDTPGNMRVKKKNL